MKHSAVFVWVAMCSSFAQVPKMPMEVDFKETTTYRWLNKPVLESRLLDDMENPSTWSFEGIGELSFTTERAIDGKQSLRLRAKTKTAEKPRTPGRAFGDAIAVRKFDNEDWTHYNRLSFWIYPDLPGFRTISAIVSLRDAEPERGRTLNYYLMRNREWNHVLWEIPDLARAKVTGLAITYRLQGNEADATDSVQFDIDHLELQRVDADYDEGWAVAPGQISFSNTGYQTGAPKRALASDLAAKEFRLVSQDTGQTVAVKPVKSVKSRIGAFQVLDFSDIDQPGTYTIQAGGVSTRPFRIGVDTWDRTIWKAVNFFYVERCGYEIPGVHLVCHTDWQGVHGDKRIIVNGGWHDAGDLSQGLVNTSEAVYAMFNLAERLRARGERRELADRLVEEARWGLDWVMKTSFGDGFRIEWATMDYWSNGIIGDNDDGVFQAINSPYANFLASAAEAIGSRVLRTQDPARAAHSLKMARQDWDFAVQAFHPDVRGRNSVVETASQGALASIDLFKLTGERKYADKAAELASLIVNSQQRTFLTGTGFAGFFYHSPEKDRLVHYIHPGHEQAPVVALARLCEALPDHPDWMKWYSAVALHSDYFQKRMAAYTEPYNMLPNGIYGPDEAASARSKEQQAIFRAEVLNGFKLTDKYYLRAYPVQPQLQFRGNNGTMLSQTKAVTTAAHLRGNLELADLGQEQLQWVVGRNPFVQSTMYGEGYDYAPQYTAMSGDIVGSLPVGIKMLGDHDLPYWPATNVWNYKEVWVHPVSRWIWVMQDLAGPALVEGATAEGSGEPVRCREASTGRTQVLEPDYATGRFRGEVPEGRYEVSSGSRKTTVTLLPASVHHIDLRPGHVLDLELSAKTAGGQVTISLVARGEGSHRFAWRTDNLSLAQPGREIDLRAGGEERITWQGRLASTDAPWVAVLVPDNDLSARREVSGDAKQP